MTEDRVQLDWVGPPGVTFYATGTEIIASSLGVDLVVMGHQVIALTLAAVALPPYRDG
jgi:hypothetical protein